MCKSVTVKVLHPAWGHGRCWTLATLDMRNEDMKDHMTDMKKVRMYPGLNTSWLNSQNEKNAYSIFFSQWKSIPYGGWPVWVALLGTG